MMMKYFCCLLLAGACCVMFSAEKTENASASKKITTVEDAKKFSQEMFELFRNNDSKRFLANLPDSLKAQFNEAQFRSSMNLLRNSAGVPEKIEFLSRLRNPAALVLLWKVEFRKETPDGRKLVQDGLLTATFVRENGVFQMAGFRFL